MRAKASPIPTDIRRLGRRGLVIVWSDGHLSEYTNHHLRHHCPCASCRERSARPLPVVGQGGEELYPVQMGVVGRYAISIQWSDGHDTGIYSYRTLREVCPCEQCRPPRSTESSRGVDARPKASV